MEHWFQNDPVIVTGGGGGIGRAASLLFAQRGARVVVTDIRADAAEVTAGLITASCGEAIAIVGDIGDPAFAAALVRETVHRFGRLACAFNNAGVFLADDCNWTDAAMQQTIHVNLIGTMNCLREEIAAMLQTGGGTIVNTASISGLVASEHVAQPAYTATKHALIGLTKAAALQYAKRNIRVNAICPGVTLTDMVRQALDYGPEARKILESGTPLGRLADPAEMAEAAVWLASAKSSFVTGHSLVVDGGFTIQ